jgi:hypothetical protein
MDLNELEKTETWKLYEKGLNYLQGQGYYSKIDQFNNFYIGNQWEGLKLSNSVSPVCLNIIKQIINQKTSTVTENLFAINYSPENGDNEEFIQNAQNVCKSLNKYASKVWDFDQLDYKVKRWSKTAGIEGQAICYVDYKDKRPINQTIKTVDIMFGDENSDDIQSQPYILVRQRLPILEVKKLIEKDYPEYLEFVVGDNDTSTMSGNREEKEDKIWVLTKFWKDKNGMVHYSKGIKYVDYIKDEEMGIKLYPFAVFNWEDRQGSARGIGEVEYLKPNQIEINKTIMRRLITVKNTAYPQKVVNEDAISDKSAVNRVGATVFFKDVGNLRASDVFMSTNPAQMSTDAEKVQAELINLSKDLSNVSEATTGNLDPSSASGRAILAVQQAQNQPLTDQVIALKKYLEDIARIWFEYWKKNSKDLVVFTNVKDQVTGEEFVREEKVDSKIMSRLETFVKVDITPRGAYDRYAQELSLENLMTGGFIDFEEYVESLDADSVMPKTKLEKILNERKEKQAQINAMQLEGEQMKDMANAQMVDAENMANIQDEGSSLMAQALDQAQMTGYGADTGMTDVSNKFRGQ